MSSKDFEEIQKFYNDKVSRHGESIESVGWGTQEDQYLRFAVLLRGLDPRGKTILDVGCGKGDLVGYLQQFYGDSFQYVGVDLSDSHIATANNKWADANAAFFCGDISSWAESSDFKEVDISLMSGAMTYKISDNEKVALETMTKMFEVSSETACLNFMTKYVDFELEKNHHYQPEKIFSQAKDLSRWVSLYHDYPLWEFTVQIHKKPLQGDFLGKN